MWKSLLDHVMFIHMQRIFTIDHMGLIIGEKITKLFFDHVFRYQGLPKDIIFNHEPQLFKPIKSWSNICDAQLIIIKIIG